MNKKLPIIMSVLAVAAAGIYKYTQHSDQAITSASRADSVNENLEMDFCLSDCTVQHEHRHEHHHKAPHDHNQPEQKFADAPGNRPMDRS